MPVVWLIDAYRAGERMQVHALADALGWHYEVKTLHYRRYKILGSLLSGSDLSGIDVHASSSLEAPWPDLLISCGLRNEPVCRWIRERSMGKSRIVHIGRPWADPRHFDLVITTPQYRIPQRENVLLNSLTLHQVTPQRLREAARNLQPEVSHLPSPYIGVILGGDSGPYTLGKMAARRLARQAADMARATGGSLLITSSSRTRREVCEVLESELDVPHYFYRWQGARESNPYFGILGLSEQFIVTADSVSMLSEACATGATVWMYDLGGMRGKREERDFRLGAILYQGLLRFGWRPLSRDISLIHKLLIADGRTRWLGDSGQVSAVSAEKDVDRAVARVKELFQTAD